MIRSRRFLVSQNIFSFLKSNHFSLVQIFLLLTTSLVLISCSATTRYPGKEVKEVTKIPETQTTPVLELRILLDGYNPSGSLFIESDVNLIQENSKVSLINSGNTIECYISDNSIHLQINGQDFEAEKFIFEPASSDEILRINGKRYRGKIQISGSDNRIYLVNILDMEDYVKGVIAKEMPIGKNNENFEALKALSICIRTYAVNKMKEGKINFDLYNDTRDQVYGGVDSENPLSNKAVDETRSLILEYDNKPAIIYYHSTCGGFTESAENVFTKVVIPYLYGVEDGVEPNCKISPRFQWEETYSGEGIINRLKSYSILDDNEYELEDISIINKFDSGRVSELEIIVEAENGIDKSIIIRGNEIRSILRTADQKNILWSTMFDISISGDIIKFTGNGFGHGVGLCQWGAISLSREGMDYGNILQHYYSGISIGFLND